MMSTEKKRGINEEGAENEKKSDRIGTQHARIEVNAGEDRKDEEIDSVRCGLL